jgi:hypothetical protein
MLWTTYCFNIQDREEGKVKGMMVGRTWDGKGTREKEQNEISL